MLAFTVSPEGANLLSSATAGTNPVIIDSVVLNNSSSSAIKTITDIAGAVISDASGIGDYVVVRFDDTSATSYTIASISLKAGSVTLATSETVSIVKQANKSASFRISCQFTDASKCGFQNTNINLPYASQSRDGVIRLARSSGETHKDRTVYSALDVEALISAGVDGSDKYVPWDVSGDTPIKGEVTVTDINLVNDYDSPTTTSTISLNGQTGGVNNISVDGYVTGTAVSSTPTISSGAVTGSPKLVNETYISNIYASEVSAANADKLVTAGAVTSYVTSEIQSIDGDYVHISGDESISGVKTFSSATVCSTSISSPSYIGTGVQASTTNWNATTNNAKLPTVEVVSAAISAVDTAYKTADSDLQSQIDGINAGQNLADIVDLISDLTSHSLAGLKAKNDYKHGDSGETWPIGDKIQVLHDKTDASGQVPTPAPDGVPTVYELVKGTIDTTTYPKDQASSTAGYYWHYIGEYGVDAYTKSQSDAKYVIKNDLDQTIPASPSTTNAPSTKAVSDAIDAISTDISTNYVKLSSSTKQTISSEIAIDTGTASSGNADIFTFSGNKLSANGAATFGAEAVITGQINYTRTVGATIDPANTLFTVGYFDSTQYGAGAANALIIDCNSNNVTGNAVADYSDILPTPPAAATDGRLVTVDYLNAYTGDLSGYAKLSAANTFTAANTFSAGVSSTSYTGTGVYSTYSSSTWETATTQLPTVASVRSAIEDAKSDVLTDLSSTDVVGSIGLFMYNEVGDQKVYGETVSGAYLKPVGMSLPLSGQISYKSVATNDSLTGTWKLLSVAFKRTATEPCLVLAQKISD